MKRTAAIEYGLIVVLTVAIGGMAWFRWADRKGEDGEGGGVGQTGEKGTPKPTPGVFERRPLPFTRWSRGLPHEADLLPQWEVEKDDGSKGVGEWRGHPAVADLDKDGFDDIVCSLRKGDGLYVFLGDGKGSWRTALDGIPRDLGYGGSAVADVNHDGNLDIVFSTHSAPVRCFLGDGAGRWKDSSEGLDNVKIMSDVTVSDFDGDGHEDIACLSAFSAESPEALMVFLGDGTGRWRRSEPVPHERRKEFGTTIVSGDIDGDGDRDLIATLKSGAVPHFNEGGGAWTVRREGLDDLVIGGSMWGLAVTAGPVAAWREGARPGAMLASGASVLTGPRPQVGIACYGWADGEWQNLSNGLPQEETFYGIALGDMDGDGEIDLVTCGMYRGITIFTGHRRGGVWSWEEWGQIPGTADHRGYIELGDFNADGKRDILCVSLRRGVEVYRNESRENPR